MKNTKKITMIFFIITAITISFNSKYDSLLKEFESAAKSKQSYLNDDIRLSSNFIEGISIYGNYFFKESRSKDSELYSILKYNTSLNNYNLDAVGGTEYEKIAGNLTGIGTIPEDGIYRNELNLALQYNEFFSKFYNRLPDVSWLYYTSENNFINLYPWT